MLSIYFNILSHDNLVAYVFRHASCAQNVTSASAKLEHSLAPTSRESWRPELRILRARSSALWSSKLSHLFWDSPRLGTLHHPKPPQQGGLPLLYLLHVTRDGIQILVLILILMVTLQNPGNMSQPNRC